MANYRNMFESRISAGAKDKLPTRAKVATPCMDDHQFKEEEMGSVGKLSTVSSQNVVKCLYLGRSVDPKFYGPWTNLLVYSQNGQKHVTKTSRTFII